MPHGNDKKKDRTVKPYDSYGTRKETSTKRSSKRGEGSKLYAQNKSKAKSKADANIQRMMKSSKQDMKKNIMTKRN